MGVWIETLLGGLFGKSNTVTPFVGVWIETSHFGSILNSKLMSHPSWVCGLKLCCILSLSINGRSHPSWVCGLKLQRNRRINGACSHTLRGCVDWNNLLRHNIIKAKWSHPSWVCGLKPTLPLAETSPSKSHPSWVCGLKHRNLNLSRRITCHTLRGCVDWNLNDLYIF